MRSKSIKGNSVEEIRKALEEVLSESPGPSFKPTLAICFISVKQDRRAICALLEEMNIAIFGATTHGEFVDENLFEGSAAILLLDLDASHFQVLFAEYPDKNYREVAARVAKKAKELFASPALLIAGSHMETDAEQLLFGFEDVIGKDLNAFGCLAGDDYALKEPFVFTNGQESNQGMVVLVMDEEKVMVKGNAFCGWKSVGTERTVTKSVGNHVYTVDDIPVIDLMIKYGGFENVQDTNREALAMEIAVNLPLQLQRQVGDPIIRSGLVIDWNDRSFYCAGGVPEGSKVRFSIPPDFDVVEKVIKGTEALKASQMPEADAVLVFSCGGRILALGPLMNMEIKGIREVWNAPMAGMFSTAELGRANGGSVEMHNATTCVIALREK
jgi:hypothetical protein